MAERELAIVMRARDLASRVVRNVRGEVSSLGRAGSRAMDGLSSAMRRVGTAAVVGLVGAIALGVRSLGHLERVTNATNAVIASTGGKAGVTAVQVRKMAESLESVTTVDDKLIQEGENLLLTFTSIGAKAFPRATKAALNMAIAMAKGDVTAVDMKASSIQLGKALNDPAKGYAALKRAGVSFTDAQIKQIKTLQKSGNLLGAQNVILAEMEKEFGKAGEAAGTGFEADMRRVQDAGEDATKALARGFMPVLARVAKFLSSKLADPAVLKAIDDLGQGLANAATDALNFIEHVDFASIAASLKTAAGFAQGLVKAFLGMPDWVKTAVITGWGLNKLSGGAVAGIVGELGKGLIKGVLGINAGVVQIKAGTVIGGGGPGIPGGGGPGGGGGVLGTLRGLVLPVTIVAVASGVAFEVSGLLDPKHRGPNGQISRATNVLSERIANTLNNIKALQERANGGDTFAAKQLQGQLTVLADLRAQEAKANLDTQNSAARQAAYDAAHSAASIAKAEGIRQAAVAAKLATDRVVTADQQIRGAVAAAAEASRLTTAAVKAKDLDVTIPVNITNRVSVRDQVKVQTTFKKYGNVYVS